MAPFVVSVDIVLLIASISLEAARASYYGGYVSQPPPPRCRVLARPPNEPRASPGECATQPRRLVCAQVGPHAARSLLARLQLDGCSKRRGAALARVAGAQVCHRATPTHTSTHIHPYAPLLRPSSSPSSPLDSPLDHATRAALIPKLP
jgi:hypothetical protein